MVMLYDCATAVQFNACKIKNGCPGPGPTRFITGHLTSPVTNPQITGLVNRSLFQNKPIKTIL